MPLPPQLLATKSIATFSILVLRAPLPFASVAVEWPANRFLSFSPRPPRGPDSVHSPPDGTQRDFARWHPRSRQRMQRSPRLSGNSMRGRQSPGFRRPCEISVSIPLHPCSPWLIARPAYFAPDLLHGLHPEFS